MADFEARNEKLELARQALQELSETDASALDRTKDLSHNINFADAVPHFEDMLEVIRQLADRDISRLPTQLLQPIISSCERLSNLITEVREFNLNVNTPADVCQGIIQKVRNAYDDVINPFITPLSFTATQATDYAKIEREAKGYLSTMTEERDKLLKYVEGVQVEGDKALAAVKEQAAEAGVSTNAQIFMRDAEEHGKQSFKWLKATIGLSVITLLAAIAFLYVAFVYKPVDVARVVQYVVSKIIVLSTLTFGMFWCNRNYRAHKHNQTLSQHRANALKTFKAFVEGTSDDKVTDAILLQAAQAAFTPRPTGYDATEKEMQTVNPVVEILGSTLTKSQTS